MDQHYILGVDIYSQSTKQTFMNDWQVLDADQQRKPKPHKLHEGKWTTDSHMAARFNALNLAEAYQSSLTCKQKGSVAILPLFTT